MKKNAFTLIELLAVIVILAIIALIATPIILGIINSSKEQTKEVSAENYLTAVEQAIVRENMKGIFRPTECIISSEGITCTGYDKPLNVEVDGEVPTSGTIILKNGKIAPNTLLGYADYSGKINENGEIIIIQTKIYNNGDIVYFDVEEGESCTKEKYKSSLDEGTGDYLNSKTGYNGYTNKDSSNNETEKLEKQNSCLKFYAFNDDGGEKLNLLLDHNTTDKVKWNSAASNSSGPLNVINQLKIDTDDWNGTITPNKYEFKRKLSSYIVNYNTDNYKARLITAQEVAQITGADKVLNWKEESSIDWFYFHDYSQVAETGSGEICASNECKYGWLYDRTAHNCEDYGCLNNSDKSGTEYWTSTARSNDYWSAWRVYYRGCMDNYSVINQPGVRPVIEVLKSKLQ